MHVDITYFGMIHHATDLSENRVRRTLCTHNIYATDEAVIHPITNAIKDDDILVLVGIYAHIIDRAVV